MEEMKSIIAALNRWAYEYYTLDKPTVSDAEYDALYDRLLSLEKKYNTVLPDSPTVRVGDKILSGFEQYRHKARLFSLDKAQTFEQLKLWIDKVKTKFPNADFSVELKYDGLCISATYDKGALVTVATRGNGTVGEIITVQAKSIRSLPLSIAYQGEIEISGEAIMKLSSLNRFNELYPEQALKNARNGAAGALRNLDPAVTAQRGLDAVMYSLGYFKESVADSQRELVDFLQHNFFKTNDFFCIATTAEEVLSFVQEIEKKRESYDFLIDGIVIKVNDFKLREELGFTDKFPRWAVAYKFEAESAATKLISVEWQVGRTGKLTPLAHLEPVELSGATIKRATLNNLEDIRRKNLFVNSTVLLRRSNDVIPEIMSVVTHSPDSKVIEPPHNCPSCGAEIVSKGAHLFCSNSKNCPAKRAAVLVHFSSKNALDIEGLSDKTVLLLMKANKISNPADLYFLTKQDFEGLEGFAEKKINNLLGAIEKSKTVALENFIYALGIDNIGIVTARDLSKRYKSIDALSYASVAELTQIEEIGEVVAQSIVSYFGEEYNLEQLRVFKEIGINPQYEQKQAQGAFLGLSVVLTGTLENYTRTQAQKLIEGSGGIVSSSVTKAVNLVIAGADAGSKLEKAAKLGIKVIDQETFEAMLKS